MPRSSNFCKTSLRVRSIARLALALALLASLVALPTLSTAQLQPSGQTGFTEKRARAEFVPGEILVRYRDDAQAQREETEPALQLKTPRGSFPMRVERFDGSELVRGLRLVRVPEEETLSAIAALRARPGVLYAEPNYVRRKLLAANDTRFQEMWGLKNTGQGGTSGGNPGTVGADIDAEPAWNITTGSRNVVVGVVDEGVDINHPDLKANVWKNPGEVAGNGLDDDANGFVDDTNGWDFFHNDKTVFDSSGAYPTDETDAHGTHVAGTIGAVGNNALGVTGVNWQVSLMSLKVLGPEDEFGASSSVLVTVRAYNYAKLMKDKWASSGGTKGANIRVLNNSYGGWGRSQAELDAIRALAASNILFVAAAGNESNSNDHVPTYPASYVTPNLISVGATNNSDRVANFSNFGPRTVSMAAPGNWILSTTPNGTYDFFSGTSMAAPHVSGAAALVCAANPNIPVRRLRAALMYSGDVLGDPDNDPYYYMAFVSGRRLNALKSLQNVSENDATPPAAITDLQLGNGLKWTAPGDNGATGRAAVYEIRFSDTQPTTGEQFDLATPLLAPFPGVAGSAEEVEVDLPYRHPSGFISIRAVDNVGNAGPITSIPVTNPVDYSDPYTVTTEAASPLSTGGTPINLKGDDVYAEGYNLPWPIQYYEGAIWNVGVSSNGVLYAPSVPNTSQGNLPDNISTLDGLNSYKMIAGLWDDLRTDSRASDDVYVVKPDANRIIFRWQAVTYNTRLTPTTSRGENPVSFEIELNRNGVIKFRYGAGNQKLWPVVGISGGKPDAYAVLSHTSESVYKSLANAQTVVFTPRRLKPKIESLTITPSTVVGGRNATAKVNLAKPASPGGDVINLSDDLAATTMPASVTIPEGQLSKTFTINTTYPGSASKTGTVRAAAGDSAATAPLTVQTIVPSSVALSPNSVAGGNNVTGTVTLNGPAPAGGAVVTLSDNLAATTVPASVNIAAGATKGTCTIKTSVVSVKQVGPVTAALNSGTKTGTLTVRPVGVLSVSVNPNPVVGGNNITGTVVLERAAPVNTTVTLSENVAAATGPASVVVSAGATSKTFTLTTTSVTSFQGGTLTASANGTTKSAAFMVNPAAAATCPAPTFKVTLTPAKNPNGFAATDFNGDGRLDLAVYSYYLKNVSTFFGDGAGNFGSQANYAVKNEPMNMATGDLNRDGKPDLVVYNGGYLSVFINNGSGGFAPVRHMLPNPYPFRIVIADFNKDLKPDLAMTNPNVDKVSLMLGDGAGGFGPQVSFDAGVSPQGLVAGDFNKDGKLDLATANYWDNVAVLLGNGAGGFGAAVSYKLDKFDHPEVLAVGDFNKDGSPDLAVLAPENGRVMILQGNGRGVFAVTKEVYVGPFPHHLLVKDMNGDGKDDIILTVSQKTNIVALFGDGVGGFGPVTQYPVQVDSSFGGLAAGDFNGDGRPDLVTSTYPTNNIAVLLNGCE